MNKVTHKAEAAEPRMSRNRYSELKQMLDERRREIHAEVQGKMRGVREEPGAVSSTKCSTLSRAPRPTSRKTSSSLSCR